MNTIKSGGFTLIYELNNDKAVITGIEGMDSILNVPAHVATPENANDSIYPVASISKKAFLGVNGLRHIVLPETVSEIGDWAFSHCRHLVSLTVLNPDITFGRGVFEGCDRLKIINAGYSDADDLSFLLATVVTRLSAAYLLGNSSSKGDAWFKNYDSSLLQYLNESDYSGSDESALCGEEDISYDDIKSVDGELLGADMSYIIGVRKNKCYLCFLRLMHDKYLADETREFLKKYICDRSVSHENNSAWLTIRDDMYDDSEAFSLYLEIVDPDKDATEAMLNNLGNEHPEMKAQLLNRKSTGNLVDNFFDSLLL